MTTRWLRAAQAAAQGVPPLDTQTSAETPDTQAASRLGVPRPEAFPYGTAPGGRPVTWTGKVVSLDEWRHLSEWERHGSTGKVWNGLTRQWEAVKDGRSD